MAQAQQIKTFNRALARYGLFGSSWLLTRLPYPLVRGLTHFFIAVSSRLAVRQRTIARESLQIAFGQEKSGAEIERIIKDCFENLGRGKIGRAHV